MYKLQKSFTANEVNAIQRSSDGAFIPMDEKNSDYIEYLRWVQDGNAPLPADETAE